MPSFSKPSTLKVREYPFAFPGVQKPSCRRSLLSQSTMPGWRSIPCQSHVVVAAPKIISTNTKDTSSKARAATSKLWQVASTEKGTLGLKAIRGAMFFEPLRGQKQICKVIELDFTFDLYIYILYNISKLLVNIGNINIAF